MLPGEIGCCAGGKVGEIITTSAKGSKNIPSRTDTTDWVGMAGRDVVVTLRVFVDAIDVKEVEGGIAGSALVTNWKEARTCSTTGPI